MRNLRAIRFEQWRPPSQYEGRSLTAATWDLANDSVLCCFGPSESDVLTELVRVHTRTQKFDQITSWDAPCPDPALPCDKILDLHAFGDSLTTCLVLAGGDITIVREAPQAGEDRIEIVGSVDAGIAAAKWSPDEELLCIVSKADTVIFMSRTFEGIKDISMTAEDLTLSKHVNVGWGKKETQFKGKGAKALKDPTVPESIDEGVLSPNDDHSVSTSWRGDGAFVAVNTVEGNKRRIIRVYSREGVLDSVSEPVDGLEGALDWKPAGDLLAGIQRMSDRVDVVFFERNGLRHGQFSLRLNPEQLKLPETHIKLSWNSDSTVLAISMPGCIQLWSMGNHHWYLKQEIETTESLTSIPYPTVWHPEKPFRILTNALDSIASHEYILTTSCGSTQAPHDHGAVAVIDGANVLLTPFRHANIPPPMALHSISVESNAVDLAFNAQNTLIAVLQKHGISIFSWNPSKASSTAPVKLGQVQFDKEAQSRSAHQQICFSGQQQLCVLERNGTTSKVHQHFLGENTGNLLGSANSLDTSASSRDPRIVQPLSIDSSLSQSTRSSATTSLASSSLADSPLVDPSESASPQIDFNAQNWNTNGASSAQNPLSPISPLISPRDTGSASKRIVSTSIFNESPVRAQSTLQTSLDHASIAVLSGFEEGGSIKVTAQDYLGGLHNLMAGDHSISTKFPTFLPKYSVAAFESGHIPFGLSSNGHLFAGPRVLVKNCTSFLVTPAHLIFTTTSHQLKLVHITDIDSLEIPSDDPEVDERCRSIERGARLVTAIPSRFSVVLQMPRGNLETIFPRALVVAGIRDLIDNKDYRRAFTTCRTQRVDMNILFDHAPDQFLSNVSLFITQLQKISYIDLFLSSLSEEDVTQTKYTDTRKAHQTQPVSKNVRFQANTPQLNQTSKVNRICDAVLDVLRTRLGTNLQNVITAHLCKSPPALEDGLRVVAHLLEQEEDELADQAAEHICFLADVKKLYESALGMYSLDLALIIAQKSQEDPREYLPFMQNLQEMDELRRLFSVDDHLGRHIKALGHLSFMQSFDEVQTYTRKHDLYQSAMSLYRYKPVELATLTVLYAQHLESTSYMKEAALAYELLRDYSKAASCYLSSGPSQWREALSCALLQTPPVPGPALQDIATYLCSALMESKDYASAATIQTEYLNSIKSAAECLCKGYFFADAIHLIALKQRPELLEEIIDHGLTDALASSTDLLADCKAQLLAQLPRLRELRAKALADPLAFYEGERRGDGDLPDDVSVAASSRLSTNNSLFTRYTNKGGSIGTAETGVSRATSKNRRREERKRARGKKGSVYEEEYLVTSIGRLVERVERSRDDIERLVVGLVRRHMLERARATEAFLAEVVGMCGACVPEVFRSTEVVKEMPATENTYTPVGADAVLQESLEAGLKPRDPPVIRTFDRLSLLGN